MIVVLLIRPKLVSSINDGVESPLRIEVPFPVILIYGAAVTLSVIEAQLPPETQPPSPRT